MYQKMYHPSKYEDHNKSLGNFAKKFNKSANDSNSRFVIKINKIENYRDDAKIVDTKTDNFICFDWEKRHTHYDKCDGFSFPTLGQFERKIKKQEIILSIQCSKDEKCFCIAWHEDYKKEDAINIGSATEAGDKENRAKRFTSKFKEIRYSNMEEFLDILSYAFEKDKFNFESIKEYSDNS